MADMGSGSRNTGVAVTGPWKGVERDLIELIREVETLKDKLRAAESQAHEERKAMLLSLLGVMDAFDRLFRNIAPKEASADRQTQIWLGNFRGVRKKLESFFKQEGVARIDSPEGKVLPGFHEVEETRENLRLETDTILEVVEQGYLWREQVLRKSKVIAVKN
jgi:molecular chaperone GrpE (heat shock protein)